MKNELSWALVLSGGGARGFAHIGFLKEMEASGFPKPSLIAGTSMGAIIGGFYACGMPPAEMERFVLEEFKMSDYLESFAFRLGGPVGQIIQTGQMLASLATKPGIDRGQKAYELFNVLTGGKNFEEVDIPFRCNAVDLANGREVVFKNGSIAAAIRASMSFPVFFDPVEIDGTCLVDGGLFNNMPVSIAAEEGYKHIIAVNVNSFKKQKMCDLKNGPHIIFRSMESVIHKLDTCRKDQAELTINVTDDATPLSFYRKKEFIHLGEQAVRENKKIIKDFFKPRIGSWKKPVICGI